MTHLKYTFLLPAFKGKYLKEALLSIREQTFTEFMVLVSDDCSPEDLKSIFDETVGDDPRFSYRLNMENMGGSSLVSHWNLLISMCETEHFIMASDDDVYDPRFLEQVDTLSVKYPTVDLIRGRSRIIDGEGSIHEEDSPREEFESQIEFLYSKRFAITCNCLPNYVFRTNAIQAEGGFAEMPIAWGSDDIAAALSCKNGVANTPDIVFSFRWSGINLTTIVDYPTLEAKFEAQKRIYAFLRSYYNELHSTRKLDQYRLERLVRVLPEDCHSFFMNYVSIMTAQDFRSTYRFLAQERILSSFTSRMVILSCWIKGRLKSLI